ncbi:hypothetical protein FRC17_006386 [Serendipita sp. 399]|nr:hypothetical protein FRC17_006386 [Serendipita sp. 399]
MSKKSNQNISQFPNSYNSNEDAAMTKLGDNATNESVSGTQEDETFQQPVRLRPLTTLKWPSIPPPPAIVDPLTINDPKPLQMPHYEAIATSADIRSMLDGSANLPVILRHLDRLSGRERERALEAILGVRDRPQAFSLSNPQFDRSNFTWLPKEATEEDLVVLRSFAETLGAVINTAVLPATGTSFGTSSIVDPNQAIIEPQHQSSGGSMGLEIAEEPDVGQ